MKEKLNDFRDKSETEVFELYKKIALEDYLYNEMYNRNKQETSNFDAENEDIYDYNDVTNDKENNE